MRNIGKSRLQFAEQMISAQSKQFGASVYRKTCGTVL